MKRFIKNFISLVVLQGAYYIIPLITLPYLVKVLGTENYGIIAYSLAFVQYFVITSDFGFNLSAPREIALNQEDIKKISEIFSSVIILKVGIALLGFILFTGIVLLFPKLNNYKEVLFLTYGVVIGRSLLPVWLFQGMEKMKLITFVNIFSRLIYLICIFVFVKKQTDILLVPLFNSIGFILAAFVGLYLSFKVLKVRFYFPQIKTIIFYLSDSFNFFLSRISVSVYTISNTFIIGTFGSMEMAGIYAIAEKLFTALQGIYHPLVNALYPFITKEQNVKIFKKIFSISVLSNFLMILIVFMFSDRLFNLLFSNYAIESIKVFKILIFACLIIAPSILLGYPFLAAFGHPKFTNYSVILASLIHLILLGLIVVFNRVEVNLIASLVVFTEFVVLLTRLYGSFKYKLWSIKNEY